ncbi:MAG: hypothetical protein ACREH9_07410, partial [Pseudomonadota bacterium]
MAATTRSRAPSPAISASIFPAIRRSWCATCRERGGITATNYLYSTAERDGSVIGLIQDQPPLEPLFGTKEAQYDPTKFNWLGTPSVETAMVLVWHTVPVNSLDDLRNRVTEMGASGANSTPAFFGRLL